MIRFSKITLENINNANSFDILNIFFTNAKLGFNDINKLESRTKYHFYVDPNYKKIDLSFNGINCVEKTVFWILY